MQKAIQRLCHCRHSEMQMASQRTFRNNRLCVRACMCARARACWRVCKRTLALAGIRRGPKAPPQGQRPRSNGDHGITGPREARERLARPLRGHHVDAHGVLGSSPGPRCNLHSSRNRRPDGRTDERNISGSGEREGPRIHRRRTSGPCYFMAAAGS